YTASQVQLQRAGIYRHKGEVSQARTILNKMSDQATHNAEYHFQLASCFLGEGERTTALRHLEKSVELDPSHTGALFQLGHASDRAGTRAGPTSYDGPSPHPPPIHTGVLMNLGVLYEDHDRYDKAAECYRKVYTADPHNDQARLFLRDAQASLTMYYNPDDD